MIEISTKRTDVQMAGSHVKLFLNCINVWGGQIQNIVQYGIPLLGWLSENTKCC